MNGSTEGVPLGTRDRALNRLGRRLRHSCREHTIAMLDDPLRDGHDLLVGLPLPEDDFGKALPKSPMMVDRREFERLSRLERQGVERLLRREPPARDLFEQVASMV